MGLVRTAAPGFYQNMKFPDMEFNFSHLVKSIVELGPNLARRTMRRSISVRA
jgi:hypothetical protein